VTFSLRLQRSATGCRQGAQPATTWTVMRLGVGAIGVSLRRRRSAAILKPV
jgi:hypothetical protein